MYRSFIRTAGAGLFAQAIDVAQVARGGQNGVAGRQQARGLALAGLGDQGEAQVRRQPVDAAVLVGGKEHLVRQRQQIVGVFLFGTPEGLHGVVGIDAIDGRLVDAAGVRDLRRRRIDLGHYRRLCLRLGFGRLDFAACLGLDRDGGGRDGRDAAHALGGLLGGLRALGDGPAESGGVDRAIGHGNDGADLG